MLLSLLPVLAVLHVKMKIPTEKILMCVKYKLSFLIQIMCRDDEVLCRVEVLKTQTFKMVLYKNIILINTPMLRPMS